MFFLNGLNKQTNALKADNQIQGATLSALSEAFATIEFTPNGVIETANALFLNAVGYQLSEIKGEHHKIFVPKALLNTPEYSHFWSDLAAGKTKQARFKRVDKKGNTIWLEASYCPVLDANGQVVKVIKLATDITAQIEKELEQEAMVTSIGEVMAMIEFDTKGNILTANKLFCDTMGYSLSELTGKHHRLFLTEAQFSSPDYQAFWANLGKGKIQKNIFKRMTKASETVWLDASYNPIFNVEGQVVKVVKFANDITAQENARIELEFAVDQFSQVISAQATGDLTKVLPPSQHFKGPLLELKDSINYSAQKVKEVVNMAIDAANVVNNAAQKVSQGSSKLSERVQEQAAALEETSATMHEMNSQMQSSRDNAVEVTHIVKKVKDDADLGVEVMKQNIEAMTAIQASSHKISDIVSLIDGIAFQTNLLALNAAVEAARAGEHGRGFAVVAGEVRNLAQKSATASKEIKTLIVETVERVNQGSKVASESSEMLNSINVSIDSVNLMIAEITTAANEQAEGISQVHQALTQIDGVTQQNSALVDETHAAAEVLSEQAQLLQKEMGFFRTGS